MNRSEPRVPCAAGGVLITRERPGSAMATAADWYRLAERFRSLPRTVAARPLSAVYYGDSNGTPNAPLAALGWVIEDGRSERADFALLAAQGAQLLGVGAETEDQRWASWLTQLSNDRRFTHRVERLRPMGPRKGRKRRTSGPHAWEMNACIVRDAIEVSAAYCDQLAVDVESLSTPNAESPTPPASGSRLHAVTEPNRATAAPALRKRAEWLRGQLMARTWTKAKLEKKGGPCRQTTQKILKGLPVRRSALEKLALALRVSEDSIPGIGF